MHRHSWKLTKQTTIFATNINRYKCSCGAKKTTYQPFGGKEYLLPCRHNWTINPIKMNFICTKCKKQKTAYFY